jgi:hypothetical protein
MLSVSGNTQTQRIAQLEEPAMKSKKKSKEPAHDPNPIQPLEQPDFEPGADPSANDDLDAVDDPSDLDEFEQDDDDGRWDVFLFDDDSDPLPEHGDFWLPD